MNRIILIGNGFDLAHGIPTSYQSFINFLWEKIITEIYTCKTGECFENDDISIDKVPFKMMGGNSFISLKENLNNHRSTMVFKNTFFETITQKSYIQNWVDIENEYYSILKDLYKKPMSKYSINQLNEDFEKITNYLKDYLINVEEKFKSQLGKKDFLEKIGSKIYSSFKLKDFNEQSINSKVGIEFEKIEKDINYLQADKIGFEELSDDKKRIITKIGYKESKIKLRELLLSNLASEYFDLMPEHILFLNFNYTSTEDLYKSDEHYDQFGLNYTTPYSSNHIHGSLKLTDNNPIIFGFGDEIDEEYKALEDLNDNRYLANIKSMKYLESDNYKKLLEYLNSSSYQIFLFGHSCGISDRTLLNTLFEHKNCVSIKPFYYQINPVKDDYSEIVRNISRNFNNKVSMRDKVVNKKYCESLS